MLYIKVVTLFDSPQHAEVVKRHLAGEGFSPGEIGSLTRANLTLAGDNLQAASLWQHLLGRDILPYEAAVYGKGARAGGVILTVRVCETELEKVSAVLNVHNAVDIRKRAIADGLISKTGSNEGPARIRRFTTDPPSDALSTLQDEQSAALRHAISDPEFQRAAQEAGSAIPPHQHADALAAAASADESDGSGFLTAADSVEVIRARMRRRLLVEQQSGGAASGTA